MEAELLEAIHAAPDDDAPRLVYADALIERGDPRGDFIVRQCRGDAAEDLLAVHATSWLDGIAPLLSEYTFERGFLATCKVKPFHDTASVIAIDRAVGLPIWSTVRQLHGSIRIARHPVLRALRVLETQSEPDFWPELLAGAPRPLTELHYQPWSIENWDHGGDITATPQSGGVWTREYLPLEFEALASCSALPALRRLVIHDIPPSWLAIVLAGPVLDRVPLIEACNGPLHVEIAGGLAVITIAPKASLDITDVALELIRVLPAKLGVKLEAHTRFPGRAIIEAALGGRLVR